MLDIKNYNSLKNTNSGTVVGILRGFGFVVNDSKVLALQEYKNRLEVLAISVRLRTAGKTSNAELKAHIAALQEVIDTLVDKEGTSYEYVVKTLRRKINHINYIFTDLQELDSLVKDFQLVNPMVSLTVAGANALHQEMHGLDGYIEDVIQELNDSVLAVSPS